MKQSEVLNVFREKLACSFKLYHDVLIRILNKSYFSNNGCWIFNGTKNFSGYGRISFKGKPHRIHRLIYSMINGEVSKKIEVCHKCDNTSCFNPDHLFSATHKENMIDMVNKGRLKVPCLKGENVAGSKVTEKDVVFIRSSKLKNIELAKMFSVTKSNITFIKNKGSWKHVN
jgi:hypothetical protein